MDFCWITSPDYREIIEADQREASICLAHGAWLACHVMVGSTLEAALGYTLQRARIDFPEMAGLQQLLDLAEKNGLLHAGEAHYLRAVKDFRNLAHPLKSLRERREVSEVSATMALQTCDYLLGELQRELAAYLPLECGEVALELAGKRLPVRRTPFTIGRAEKNDCVLHDERVSALHARLVFAAGRFFLEDCQSKNGTYLLRAGQIYPLWPDRPEVLLNGDSFRLSEQEDASTFIFVLAEQTLSD